MPTARSVRIATASAEETRGIGRALAASLRARDVVLLHGDLGAGKTTLAQGIALGLGVPTLLPSPTFVLAQEYPARTLDGHAVTLRHLDLYRLADEAEAASLGYEELLDADEGIALVEWPERASGLAPDAYLLVGCAVAGTDRRWFELTPVADPDSAQRWLGALDRVRIASIDRTDGSGAGR